MKERDERREAGFSIIELMIAMAVTLIVMTAATTLLASSLKIRVRENQKSDALADAQRALNIMSRDIANAGFGLDYNGIVTADSGQTAIRIRANVLNVNSNATDGQDEDVMYVFQNSNAIVRYDPVASPTTVSLASRINSLQLQYYDYSYDSSGTLVTSGPNNAPTVNTGRVRITVSVTLDAVGNQPAATVQLTSDVTLRNAPFMLGRY
ncbi:MAG TPA: prepilin-type N-terminal cleavage/methylation domain-containing protein [Pyrinomonadaceae bacterium]|nr:prepilin-type N-terminal cleavage/methylation domain-containing protein [Pyrinomonadaceae bacterium]